MLGGLLGAGMVLGALAAADRPLTRRERQDLAKAAVWEMDVEADGGSVPLRISQLLNRSRSLTPKEAREVLRWFYDTAPGELLMGTIKQGDWSYTLTPTDKLWAARMVEGEGPAEDSAAVLWTMTQLFAPAGQQAKYGNPHRFRSFTRLIQAYSQPINPIWRRDGSRCTGSSAGTQACSATRLARRDRIATMPYSAIDPEKRAIVERWFKGSLPNPVPHAIEFAAPNVSRSFMSRNPGWTAVSGGSNWFIRPPGGLPAATIAGGAAAGAILLVGGGLALAWFGGRWLRRRRSR